MVRVIISPSQRRWGIVPFVLLVAVLALVGFVLFSERQGPLRPEGVVPPSSSPQAPSVRDASVRIVFSSERVREFRGPVIDGMTVSAALLAASRAGNFEVEFSNDGTLSSLAGMGGAWSVGRNGNDLDGHLDEMPISPGDEIVVARSER